MNTNPHDHLAPFERAARIYCHQVGANPDAIRKAPHPFIKGVTVDAIVWHEAAEQLLNLSAMLSSLKQAAEQAKQEQRTVQ